MAQESALTQKQFYQPIKTDWIKQSGLSEADFDREISFAIQHIHKNPMLAECDQTSVLRSVINLAQVGLTLNPISKYAYLIPRYNRIAKRMECVLDPDYRGLVKLLTDSGAVKSIQTNIVWEGDRVEINQASSENPVEKHTPHWLAGNKKGNILGVYSIATLSDNSKHFEQMSYDEICDIRQRSESFKAYLEGKIKSCIWVSDEPEMCRKTTIKRHYKYLPKSSGLEKFERAVELDNQTHGFDEPVAFGRMTVIEQMIWNSSLDDIKKETMTKRMNALQNKSEAFKLIDDLKDSQPIIGLDRPPVAQYEVNKAAKDRADRDDFQERNKVVK